MSFDFQTRKIKEKLLVEAARFESLEEQRKKLEKEIIDLRVQNVNQETAQGILQEIVQVTQEQITIHLNELVSSCLSSIFNEPYIFKMSYVQKRGKTEVEYELQRGNLICDDPLHSVGGGVIDVISFALRIAALLISVKHPRKVLFLDEPFRFLSKEYQSACGLLMEELSARLGIQFVIITHEESLVEYVKSLTYLVENGKVEKEN